MSIRSLLQEGQEGCRGHAARRRGAGAEAGARQEWGSELRAALARCSRCCPLAITAEASVSLLRPFLLAEAQASELLGTNERLAREVRVSPENNR